MDQLWLVWLILAIVFLVIEVATVSLVSIWFTVGSVVGLIASLLGASLPLQIILMLGVSILLLVIFLVNKDKWGIFPQNRARTNADRLVGKEGKVIQTIDPMKNTGQVMIQGQIWSARTDDDTTILEGNRVIVKDIKGVKLIVSSTN